MRPLRGPGVVLSLLLMVPALPAAEPVSVDCGFDASRIRTPEERWREGSEAAERMAPSPFGPPAPHATSGGRRRAVTPSPAPTFEAKNFIDDEIFGKMVRDGVKWTTRSSDGEFLRRVYLDLTGQIPEAAAAKAFLADSDPNKREKLIDSLLASEEFVERWTLWLGDHVQNTNVTAMLNFDVAERNRFYDWMKESIRSGKPYDQMAREMVSAAGLSITNAPVVYWLRQIATNGPIQDTYDNLAAESGEKFLGLPMTCLSCHNGLGHLEQVNSSLVKRTRMEFWRNAAFFAQTAGPPANRTGGSFQLTENTTGEYRLNTRSGNKSPREAPAGQSDIVAPAFFLTGGTPQQGETRRQAYARMLTAHPQFARATVNFIWKQIFNLGIVEPADSHDLLRQDPATLPPGAALQPTHPELLTKLATEFTARNYNLRSLLKTITMSNAYQLSAVYTPGPWSDAWTPYFARRYARRVMAESMLDSITRATSVPISIPVSGMVSITRAVAIPGPSDPAGRNSISPFLNAFGRGDRDQTPRAQDSSIVQALMMMNDPNVALRVRAVNNNSTTDKALKASRDPAVITDELYVATLSRYPTAAEKAAAVAYLSSGDITRNTEDLQFALMNRLEFLFH